MLYTEMPIFKVTPGNANEYKYRTLKHIVCVNFYESVSSQTGNSILKCHFSNENSKPNEEKPMKSFV